MIIIFCLESLDYDRIRSMKDVHYKIDLEKFKEGYIKDREDGRYGIMVGLRVNDYDAEEWLDDKISTQEFLTRSRKGGGY